MGYLNNFRKILPESITNSPLLFELLVISKTRLKTSPVSYLFKFLYNSIIKSNP